MPKGYDLHKTPIPWYWHGQQDGHYSFPLESVVIESDFLQFLQGQFGCSDSIKTSRRRIKISCFCKGNNTVQEWKNPKQTIPKTSKNT